MPPFTNILFLTGLALLRLAAGFSGDFELSNIVVSSPFQANPNSTLNTFVSFDFADQDTPDIQATHCCVEWKVGLSPPLTYSHSCENNTFSVLVTEYHGVQNVSLQLSHTYIDNSIGKAPWNVLTKYAGLNLTYPETPEYECDLENAECQSCDGATFIAVVHSAVA